MDLIVHFFRDILNGNLYWIIVVVSVIFILLCIRYLISISTKKQQDDITNVVHDMDDINNKNSVYKGDQNL